MRVLFLSEHYEPKISGTSSYSRNLIESLSKRNDLEGFFLCPSSGYEGEVTEEKIGDCTFLRLGVNAPQDPQFTAEERKILVNYVDTNLIQIVKKHEIEVVHLLYGYFLSEVIDTKSLRELGIRTVLTVHNIPPEECSISWPGDNWNRKLKDDFRKIGVGWINRKRLKKNSFQTYITPSNYVKQLVLQAIPKAEVVVVPHGGAELINVSTIKEVTNTNHLKLLTAGGIVPHKQQGWIPEIASFLIDQGLHFEWNIIGPFRNERYSQYIKERISFYNVQDSVNLIGPVRRDDLERYYTDADAYIQLSKEEGFCMTVLDALAYGKLVMATPVGAIVEMIELAGGILLDPQIDQLKKVLAHYLKISIPHRLDQKLISKFRDEYNWDAAADKVIKVYKR